jgi:chemotaxis protein CheX
LPGSIRGLKISLCKLKIGALFSDKRLTKRKRALMQKIASMKSIVSANDLRDGLLHALQDLFINMFNERATLIPPEGICDQPRISSVVGFAGRLTGCLLIHFNPDVACALAGALLGTTILKVDETVCDAIGEMVNMLAGGLKHHVSRNEEMFKVSIPSVIAGQDYATHAPADSQILLVGVSAGPYTFKVQLVIEG